MIDGADDEGTMVIKMYFSMSVFCSQDGASLQTRPITADNPTHHWQIAPVSSQVYENVAIITHYIWTFVSLSAKRY